MRVLSGRCGEAQPTWTSWCPSAPMLRTHTPSCLLCTGAISSSRALTSTTWASLRLLPCSSHSSAWASTWSPMQREGHPRQALQALQSPDLTLACFSSLAGHIWSHPALNHVVDVQTWGDSMPVLCDYLWLQAVTELLKLAPSTAVLLTRDKNGITTAEEEVPVALVQQGDLLKV